MGSIAISSPKALLRTCRRLRKQGHYTEAGELLADALRRNVLDAPDILHAGRMIERLDEHTNATCELRISVLGQCTTSWIVPALAATARGRRQIAHVEDSDYDNVYQGLSSLNPNVDAVVLLPWSQRLFGGPDRAPSSRLKDELEFWQRAWSMMAKHAKARLIKVGYDWVDCGARGHHLGAADSGKIDLVRRLNSMLRENLPEGAYFVDLEQISGTIGRDRFYDRRQYYWTKQPFSDEGVVRLAEYLWSGVRATFMGPKKVLVLDLDNTIWGGVVGETGPLDVELGETAAGEAYRDFQRLVKELADLGCLIAVCSKNNPKDAREPFELNPNMLLRLGDITAFEASWKPKVAAIRRISTVLELGLDTFVFFDDEPAEREHVRQALPDVEVVDVPDDPADYRQALLHGLWFEAVRTTDEDRLRTKQYRIEGERRQSRSSLETLDDYLCSLDMIGEVDEINENSLERVVQLIGKTNQFNLTTRRHSRDFIVGLLSRPETVGLTLRMRDRFGDYGLVSVIIAVCDDSNTSNKLRIDTWIMSCRIIGRTAEQFLFNALLDHSKMLRYSELIGEYVPSKKNAIVADLYDRLGFSKCSESFAGDIRFKVTTTSASIAPTFIRASDTVT